MVQLAYTPCAPKDIGRTLNTFFAERTPEGGFNRATSMSQILLARDKQSLSAKGDLVQTLSEVRPGKFFELYFLPEGTALETSVAAHCVALDKKLHMCTEFIRIGGSPAMLPAMLSIVRAHGLTGVRSELFLGDWDLDRRMVLGVVGAVDQVMFDSTEAKDFGEVVGLVRELPSAIDLLWAGLAIWREQVRSIFEREILRAMLPNLSGITIDCQGRAPIGAWCLAGWLLTKLGFAGRFVKSGDELVCENIKGQKLRLAVRETKEKDTGSLTALSMEFPAGKRLGHVRFEKREELWVSVDVGTGYSYRRRLEDETTIGKLKKYLLIGESMTNYVRSLTLGHELKRAFA